MSPRHEPSVRPPIEHSPMNRKPPVPPGPARLGLMPASSQSNAVSAPRRYQAADGGVGAYAEHTSAAVNQRSVGGFALPGMPAGPGQQFAAGANGHSAAHAQRPVGGFALPGMPAGPGQQFAAGADGRGAAHAQRPDGGFAWPGMPAGPGQQFAAGADGRSAAHAQWSGGGFALPGMPAGPGQQFAAGADGQGAAHAGHIHAHPGPIALPSAAATPAASGSGMAAMPLPPVSGRKGPSRNLAKYTATVIAYMREAQRWLKLNEDNGHMKEFYDKLLDVVSQHAARGNGTLLPCCYACPPNYRSYKTQWIFLHV